MRHAHSLKRVSPSRRELHAIDDFITFPPLGNHFHDHFGRILKIRIDDDDRVS